MKPIISKRKEERPVEGIRAGRLGIRAVTHEELAGMKGRFSISRGNINRLDIKNIGIGQRMWEWMARLFGGKGKSDEQKNTFDLVKQDVKKLKEKRADMLANLQTIETKLENLEYLDSKEVTLLKKMLLIEEQKLLGIEDAAEKTEAFYRFDTVIESKTKEAFKSFKEQINKLNLNLESTLEFVDRKVAEQQDFNANEIKMVRDTIFSALVAKRTEKDNAAKIQKLGTYLAEDEQEISTLKKQQLGLKSELLNTKAEVKKTGELLKITRGRLVELTHRNDVLNEKGVLQAANNEELKKENDRLYDINEALKSEFEKLDDKVLLQDKQLKEAKTEKGELEGNINQLNRDVNDAKKENEELRQGRIRWQNMEAEYNLLRERTADFDEMKNELFALQGMVGSLSGKKEELAALDKQLTEKEKAFQELEEMETRQTEMMEILTTKTTQLLLLGQMIGAAIPEEMRREFALNMGEEGDINKLLNKEELTTEEVEQLKTWMYTSTQEKKYENNLRQNVPKPIENLQTAFEEAGRRNEEERYLEKLKTDIKVGDYPDLITSDRNPRVFVFFVDEELLTIKVKSVDDIAFLEEQLQGCRERAAAYKRFEAFEKAERAEKA